MSKKNSAKQDSSPAAGRVSDRIPIRRSAIRPGGSSLHFDHSIALKKIHVPGETSCFCPAIVMTASTGVSIS